MAVTTLDNIQLRLPGFYDKHNENNENSVLYEVVSSFADADKSRNDIIDRVNDAIGIDTICDEDLQYRFGSLLSMNKKSDESYTAYRNRLKMAYPSLVGGTENAIRYAIASAIGITDDQKLIDDYIKVYDAWEEYDGPDVVRTGTNIQINQSISSYADITKVEGASSQVVTVQGKNLLDFVGWSNGLTAGRGTISNITTSSFTMTSTANDCYTNTYDMLSKIGADVLPSTAYTLSLTKLNNTVGSIFMFFYTNKADIAYSSVVVSGTNKITFTTPSDCTYVRFRIGIANTGFTDTFSNLQLELGSTATTYEPFIPNSPSPSYPSPIITPSNFNLTASNGTDSNSLTVTQSMGASPNGIKDTIEKVNGATKYIQRVRSIVFDGSADESWSVYSQSNFMYRVSVSNIYYNSAVKSVSSSHYKPSKADQVDDLSTCSFFNWVLIRDTTCATLDALKAKLASSPVTVQYQLATPIETIITDLTLTSYKGTTSIVSTANPQVNITVAFKDAIYTVIHNTPNEYKTYCNILCIIDLTVGQNASDMEQEIIDAINIVKASGIKPHVLYIGIRILSYSDISRFNYISLGGLSYSELAN